MMPSYEDGQRLVVNKVFTVSVSLKWVMSLSFNHPPASVLTTLNASSLGPVIR